MDLTRRICKSYKTSLDDKEIEKHDSVSQDSMWIHWIKPKINDILINCYNNNVEKTYYNLSNPYKNDITFGFEDFFMFKTFKE